MLTKSSVRIFGKKHKKIITRLNSKDIISDYIVPILFWVTHIYKKYSLIKKSAQNHAFSISVHFLVPKHSLSK